MKKFRIAVPILIGFALVGTGFVSAAQQTLTAQLGAYPGSEITPPQGSVTVSFDNELLNVAYNVQGVAPSSTGGIHIHTGTSCAVAAEVGGHYWDAATGDDTWKGVKWRSNDQGASAGGALLTTGYDYQQNIGHALVVHNANGARIACGVLQAK